MWDSIKVVESSNKNVKKYVFTKDDAVAESVLYKYPTYEERTVICCSTQSGCPVGCRFCGAGDNFVRSLTADEIVSQPVKLLEDTGVVPTDIKKLQIMFMSMGEPLLNLTNLEKALDILYGKFPNAALLISTIGPDIGIGPYERLYNLAVDIPTIGLQFSVHKSTNEERNKLIPFKKKLTLKEIGEEGIFFLETTGRRPFFNYCVGDDNNTVEDADRLAFLFPPNVWNATLSVICERKESVAAANERQRQLALDFEALMLERGYNTRVFDPAGQDDIAAGCGQLWETQKWMRENKSLARPSCGYELPVIHTPK